MKLGYFLGGALLGAAGLVAAALLDDKRNPRPQLPEPDTARGMNAERVAHGLSLYSLRAAALNMEKTTELLPSAGVPPVDFDDDGLLDKLRNRVGEGVLFVDRKLKLSGLRGFFADAEKLYRRHRCLFVRANAILQEHGQKGVNLKELAPRTRTLELDASMANEDWLEQYDELLEAVQDFITATSDAANLLAERLEALPAEAATAEDPDATASAMADAADDTPAPATA